eukprot:TRINITY_DN30141_c0_g1_i1.p1 TRINITY_DN30141_c0_g1~~TRINITY_DN30141_c0_g1_i1.p1  ORF type:complete len:929 (+),score=245.78 TRINITY_DN30141_c0_g1_i1:72-2858(+)
MAAGAAEPSTAEVGPSSSMVELPTGTALTEDSEHKQLPQNDPMSPTLQLEVAAPAASEGVSTVEVPAVAAATLDCKQLSPEVKVEAASSQVTSAGAAAPAELTPPTVAQAVADMSSTAADATAAATVGPHRETLAELAVEAKQTSIPLATEVAVPSGAELASASAHESLTGGSAEAAATLVPAGVDATVVTELGASNVEAAPVASPNADAIRVSAAVATVSAAEHGTSAVSAPASSSLAAVAKSPLPAAPKEAQASDAEDSGEVASGEDSDCDTSHEADNEDGGDFRHGRGGFTDERFHHVAAEHFWTPEDEEAWCAAETRDYYAALGLSPGIRVSTTRVRACYHRLSVKWHPRNAWQRRRKRGIANLDEEEQLRVLKRESLMRFWTIMEAYLTLKDPERKRIYDECGLSGLRRSESYAAEPLFENDPFQIHDAFFSGDDPEDRDFLLSNGGRQAEWSEDDTSEDEEEIEAKALAQEVLHAARSDRGGESTLPGGASAAQSCLEATLPPDLRLAIATGGTPGGPPGAPTKRDPAWSSLIDSALKRAPPPTRGCTDDMDDAKDADVAGDEPEAKRMRAAQGVTETFVMPPPPETPPPQAKRQRLCEEADEKREGTTAAPAEVTLTAPAAVAPAQVATEAPAAAAPSAAAAVVEAPATTAVAAPLTEVSSIVASTPAATQDTAMVAPFEVEHQRVRDESEEETDGSEAPVEVANTKAKVPGTEALAASGPATVAPVQAKHLVFDESEEETSGSEAPLEIPTIEPSLSIAVSNVPAAAPADATATAPGTEVPAELATEAAPAAMPEAAAAVVEASTTASQATALAAVTSTAAAISVATSDPATAPPVEAANACSAGGGTADSEHSSGVAVDTRTGGVDASAVDDAFSKDVGHANVMTSDGGTSIAEGSSGSHDGTTKAPAAVVATVAAAAA